METLKEIVAQEQYLTFMLAGGEFAFNILCVKEILEYDTVTAVPKTPRWIRGVFNLRGAVVPVVDLAVKFGVADTQVTKSTCIIIVETCVDGHPTTMGVIADAVNQVMDVSPDDIRPVPEFGTGIKVDYLLGVTRIGKKFALLLATDKVLSADELLNLSEVSSLIQEPGANEASEALPPESQVSEFGDDPTETEESLLAKKSTGRPRRRTDPSETQP